MEKFKYATMTRLELIFKIEKLERNIKELKLLKKLEHSKGYMEGTKYVFDYFDKLGQIQIFNKESKLQMEWLNTRCSRR